MLNLILLLSFAAVIGYLAQVTGLCMVRGVHDWVRGRKLRLIAILGGGFWVYLYLPFLSQNSTIPIGYELHWSFLLGGLIFGLGAVVNGACSISTASRLSSGDLQMIFTMMGWLGGWLLLDFTGIQFQHTELTSYNESLTWIIVLCLILGSVWVYVKQSKSWNIWSGIMLVGILAGAIFLLQPAWSPSDFVKDLGLAILRKNPQILPAVDRIAILMVMLLGMSIGAWRYRRFKWLAPNLRGIIKHFSSGILMGLGAAISLGGNDFQLLMALPAQSLSGILAIAGIIIGIRLGIFLNARHIFVKEIRGST